VADPSRADEVASRIDETFANSTAETKAETEGAFIRGFAKQIGDIGRIMVAVLSAVFFTILLVAGNTMAQSVRERAEDLGLLKSLGFSNGRVLGLVLGESCALSLLGGLTGLGIAAALIARGDPTGGALPTFYFPATSAWMGAGLAAGLGLAAGILPAWQAARLPIAEALRRI
jgi:putative ABC transport system permease protein